MMTTYFISDIHLQAECPKITADLLQFLQGPALQADALYILGDLFAVWFGDDLDYSFADPIIAALNALNQNNIPIYFMAGNRDFLIGEKFCKVAHMQMLPDPYIIDLYGKPVLLTHGDLLCTLDTKYQTFRFYAQHPICKALFLAIPKFLRIKFGNWLRYKARSRVPSDYLVKNSIYDVNPTTVAEWFDKYNVKTMIHGHTHQPSLNTIDDKQRIVLGDWSPRSAFIVQANADTFKLFDLTTN